ncbi:MAG: helix-turn-helix domain-containing protein [Betaproteobacteria bacterium]|nr:helix-turn-helix domain-containing protein [Betaproteobacteria bacterium]
MSEILNLRDLGKVVRAERKARKLTQTGLAKLAGLSRQTIISLEEGNDAGMFTLMKILLAMNLRLDLRPADPDFTQLGKLFDEA